MRICLLPGLLLVLTGGTGLLSRSAAAQTQPGAIPVMTLAQALAYCRTHQPLIHHALLEVARRRSEARVPRAAWIPRIGATAQLFVGTSNNTSANYLNVPEVAIERVGGTPASPNTSFSPSPSSLLAISVGQEVYDFGRIAAQTATLDALAEAARQNADVTWLDIQLSVEEAYDGVLAAKQVLNATREALRRAIAHRDLAQAGVKSGLRPPVDLTRAQAEVAQAEVRRIRAESGLVEARAALAANIGAEALEMDAAEGPPPELLAPPFSEVLRLVLDRHPSVLLALMQLRAQRATTRELTRELLPNLFVAGTLSGRAGGAVSQALLPVGDGWLPTVGNWHVGAVLSWDLLDGPLLARRTASAARERVVQAGVDIVRREVTLLVQKAYLDLDAAGRALPGLQAAVDAARANQAQADARFRAGLGTIVELTDAETLLINAQLDLAIGQFSVARARAQLGRAIGESLPPEPTAKAKGR